MVRHGLVRAIAMWCGVTRCGAGVVTRCDITWRAVVRRDMLCRHVMCFDAARLVLLGSEASVLNVQCCDVLRCDAM